MRFGTAISQPISCVVMNFAIGANSALMIASNAPTASFAIPPVTPPSEAPQSGRADRVGFKIVGPICSACAAGGEAAQSSSTTTSTTAPRTSSCRRLRVTPPGPRRSGRAGAIAPACCSAADRGRTALPVS